MSIDWVHDRRALRHLLQFDVTCYHNLRRYHISAFAELFWGLAMSLPCHTSLGRLVLIAITLGVAGLVLAEERVPYDFRLDGKPFQPPVHSFNGTPEKPAPGDLIYVFEADMWLTLDDECRQHFVTTPKEDGRLFLESANQERKVVGATANWTFTDKKITYNPFAKIPQDAMRGLRGVKLESLPEGWDAVAAQLDPKIVCLTIGGYAIAHDGLFPALPGNLTYLRVEESSNTEGVRDYSALLTQSTLRYLEIDSMTGPVNLSDLRNCAVLEHLRLSAWKPANFPAIAHLRNIRTLQLRGTADELDNIAFVRQMAQLRELQINGTKVSDLSPLSGLKALEFVDADRCPIDRLPTAGSLPALKKISIMSTKLSGAAVDDFARAQPRTTVRHRWGGSLKLALQGADYIRVRSGGTCHRDPKQERVLAEEKDAAQIQKLVKSIEVDEKNSGFHCMCCGNPSIEFYQHDKLLLTLGFHHGRSLRWPEGWPGDAALSQSCTAALKTWLADHRVTFRDPE